MAQFFKDSLHIVSRMTDSDKHVVPPRRQENDLCFVPLQLTTPSTGHISNSRKGQMGDTGNLEQMGNHLVAQGCMVMWSPAARHQREKAGQGVALANLSCSSG